MTIWSAAAALLWAALAAGCTMALSRSEPYRVTLDLAPAIHDLGSDDLFDSAAASDLLVALGPTALPALTFALETEPPAVRAGVVEVLSRLGTPESGPLLVRAAGDEDEEVRRDALLALGTLADDRGREVVEAALDDRNPRIRRAAVGACASLCRSPKALSRLVEMAIHDMPSSQMMGPRQSLGALLGSDDRDQAEATREAVEAHALPLVDRGDAPFDSRVRAALLLADANNRAAAPLLCAAVQQADDQYLTFEAARALGSIGDAAVVGVLAELVNKADRTLASAACAALRTLTQRGVAGAATAARNCARPKRP